MSEPQYARLRGTDRIYRVIELFNACAGFNNGVPIIEEYARCEGPNGQPATWKRSQLVKVKPRPH